MLRRAFNFNVNEKNVIFRDLKLRGENIRLQAQKRDLVSF